MRIFILKAYNLLQTVWPDNSQMLFPVFIIKARCMILLKIWYASYLCINYEENYFLLCLKFTRKKGIYFLSWVAYLFQTL